jgi:hypothetical protein
LSKLFDQLKNAARDREQRSPGLLIEALQRKAPPAAEPDRPTADEAPAQSGDEPAPASVAPANPAFAGIALAIAIFAAVVVAWNAAPWRAPQKIRIEPTELKLDRNLDLQRRSPKGTTSPSRPS